MRRRKPVEIADWDPTHDMLIIHMKPETLEEEARKIQQGILFNLVSEHPSVIPVTNIVRFSILRLPHTIKIINPIIVQE